VNGTTRQTTESSFLRDFLFIVFKRKLPLTLLLVIGVAIVAYGVMTSVPEYQASARILIKRTRQAYEMPTETAAVLKRGEVVNTELQIIMSSAVAEAVVDKLGLDAGGDRAFAIERLGKRIRARALPEADIIDIEYRDTDARRAARVVNSAVEAYLEIRKGVELSTQALSFLEKQARRARAARDSVAAEMAELGAREGVHELGVKTQMQMNLEERYHDMLVSITKDIEMRERQLAVVEEWMMSGRPVADVKAGAVYDSDSVRRAQAALADLAVKLADARALYAPDHPEVQRIERQIAATELVVRGEIEQSMESQRLRLEELRAEKGAVEDMIARLHEADRDVADTELQLKLLQHDLSLRVDLYDIITNRMEQFRITAATDPNLLNVSVVSWASVPARPTPRPVNMRVVVGVFTIFFGVLLVFALEKMDQSLQSREAVVRHLGVKVLASIPDRRFHPRGR
jgi:succinoglycan biosynthesis transport protein ExoP